MEEKSQRTTLAISEFTERVMNEYPNQGYRALVESTPNYWIRVHDVLENIGVDSLVTHPAKTKLIAKTKLKNDRVDSEILADLLRSDFAWFHDNLLPYREDMCITHETGMVVSVV